MDTTLTDAIKAKADELRAAAQAVTDAKANVKRLKNEIRDMRKAIAAALSTGKKITKKTKPASAPKG